MDKDNSKESDHKAEGGQSQSQSISMPAAAPSAVPVLALPPPDADADDILLPLDSTLAARLGAPPG